MIPKVIHYCWISGDPFPEKIQKCYDSWKRVLPDYKIIVWDYAKAHAIGSKWVDQAIATKKYAFVADYIRFYALYNYGGIYLDSDVEVLKSFNDLLVLRYFIGKEKDSEGGIEAAIIGAEKGLPWVKTCLNYYKNQSFIDAFGEGKTTECPLVMRRNLIQNHELIDINSLQEWKDEPSTICLFPADWFSPKSWRTLEIKPTANTYCIHHFSASWKANAIEYKKTPLQSSLFFLRRCWRWSIKRIKKLLNGPAK